MVPLLVITPLLGGSGAQLGAALQSAAVRPRPRTAPHRRWAGFGVRDSPRTSPHTSPHPSPHPSPHSSPHTPHHTPRQVRSVSALVLIFASGQLLLNRVFKLVANSKDQTAFLAVTLLTVLGLSGFTHALGLSDTLGAVRHAGLEPRTSRQGPRQVATLLTRVALGCDSS